MCETCDQVNEAVEQAIAILSCCKTEPTDADYERAVAVLQSDITVEDLKKLSPPSLLVNAVARIASVESIFRGGAPLSMIVGVWAGQLMEHEVAIVGPVLREIFAEIVADDSDERLSNHNGPLN